MRLIKQGLVVAGSAAILFSQVGFVGAVDTATINNTGANSWNKIKIVKSFGSSVSQKNTSHTTNSVVVGANTGGNKANQNTGDGQVTSGGIAVGVGIANGGNSNAASTGDCGCLDEDVDATIEETGADSTNKILYRSSSWNDRYQKNKTWLLNSAVVGADTGNNKANQNTGNGSVDTSDVEVAVEVVNEGDTNVLE